jgi:hypothetical protein
VSKRFCCLFPTGRVSYRNKEDGTWFIQEFCKELEINGDMVDLLSLFTNVNRRVALYKGHQQKKQMPVVQSTLLRKIFFSSTTIRSRITITPDVTSLVQKTNKKLDYITEMFEDTITSLSVSKVMPTIKHNSSLSWESLHSSKQTITHCMPQGEAVHKLAVALKMFLEDEAHRLELIEKENGEFILQLLSCWENLNAELMFCVYSKLVLFLNTNAKNWKPYNVLYFPDSSSVSGQQCH